MERYLEVRRLKVLLNNQLLFAAKKNNLNLLIQSINRGADNLEDALWEAAIRDHLEIVEYLMYETELPQRENYLRLLLDIRDSLL
jgi:exonuclease VII small subunit